MRFAAWYGIVVGALMLAQWAYFLAAGSVPELRAEPYRIAFHLVGEFATALGLIVAGAGLLRAKHWGRTLYPVAAGMVIYSEVVSPGYFAQHGQWPFVAMFALLLALAILSVTLLARDATR
jgi:hypothetical protein